MGKLGRGTGRPNPSCETKFSGANGHREIFNFPRSADVMCRHQPSIYSQSIELEYFFSVFIWKAASW